MTDSERTVVIRRRGRSEFSVIHSDTLGAASVKDAKSHKEALRIADIYVISHGARLIDETEVPD